MLAEPIAVTTAVTDALDALGVEYATGDSLAGAVHGAVRATMGTDLVADLRTATTLDATDLLERALDEAG